MDDGRQDRVTIEALLAKVEQSPYRALLHDDQQRRHLLATMMAKSDDPILREMGEQLRDGLVTSMQLLSVPEYWDTLSHGYDRLGGIDLDQISEQLDAAGDAPWTETDPRDRPT
jgi:hypothetical protein